MTGAHCTRKFDLAVRCAGVALVALAYLAVLALTRSPTLRDQNGPSRIDAVLAATSFLSTSFGMAAICLGGHLFERVTVSDRWRPRDLPRRGVIPSQGVEDGRPRFDASTFHGV